MTNVIEELKKWLNLESLPENKGDILASDRPKVEKEIIELEKELAMTDDPKKRSLLEAKIESLNEMAIKPTKTTGIF